MEEEVEMDKLAFTTFTDDEFESLQLFHKQVGKMNECKVIKERLLKINVSHENTGNGVKTTVKAPEDDELASLLLRIRPCLLKKDRIYFNKILNILGRRSANRETREYFKALNKNYNDYLKTTAIAFRVDGVEYGELDVFNAFLNGDYFHVREEEPRRIVDIFEKVPHMSKTAVISTLIDYMGWFTILDSVIKRRILA
jgi:hypothetical protein